jgi:hypothetical protein
MEEKLCSSCKITRTVSDYREYPTGSFRSVCKHCDNEKDKQRKKDKRKKNLETTICECEKCHVHLPLSQFAKLKVNYKRKICLTCYPKFLTEQKTKWCADERERNVNYRLKKSLAARLRTVLTKTDSTMNYVGCPIQYLREWFEYNFTPKMNWDNYGSYWAIDHVIPVKQFDLTNELQKRICWNWTNLVPLSASANSSKKATLDHEQIKQVQDALKRFKEEGSTTKWFSDEYNVYGRLEVSDNSICFKI